MSGASFKAYMKASLVLKVEKGFLDRAAGIKHIKKQSEVEPWAI